jgi:hypothetical protein
MMSAGGRLTLQAGSPIATVDQAGKSTAWYCPDKHGYIDTFYAGAWRTDGFLSGPTDQLGVQIDLTPLAANTLYRAFATYNGTAIVVLLFPNANITKAYGVDVNADALPGLPQWQGRWIGSIYTDASAGKVTTNLDYGQNRSYGLWNRYNQKDIRLNVGDAGVQYVPTNQYPAFVPYNNDPLNRANIFTDLPTLVDIGYHQSMFINSSVGGASGIIASVGWNGVSVGYWAKMAADNVYDETSFSSMARYVNPAAVGLNKASLMIAKANTPNSTVWGGSGSPIYPIDLNQVLIAKWRG